MARWLRTQPEGREAARIGYFAASTGAGAALRADVVFDLNRQAQAQLRCETSLAVVPGATHFDEPGTLEAAAALARDWFVAHLVPARQPAA